jgi:hypothetical protein
MKRENWFQSLLSNGSTCTAYTEALLRACDELVAEMGWGLYKLNPADPRA